MRKDILEHFEKADQKLHAAYVLVKDRIKLEPAPPEDYFKKLTRHIVYQQISGKAGDAIWGRYEGIAGKNPKPDLVIEIPHEKLRAAGLSNSKAAYIKNIAQAFVDELIKPQELTMLEDEKIIETLTQIKGVGRWTAEMFLMFTLGREDVFSVGDLGLVKGFRKVYGMKKNPSPKYLQRMTKKWSPYRSYASLVLWASLDNLNPQ